MPICLIPYFRCVDEDTRMVTTRCGIFQGVQEPGCVCIIPLVKENAGTVSMRTRFQPRKVTTKTKDDVFIQIEAYLVYKVKPDNVYQAFYSLHAPHRVISSNIADVIRGVVPTMTMDEVFEGKDKLAATILQRLQGVMESYGYTVVDALISSIDPDTKVKRSLNNINAARRIRTASIAKGEGLKHQLTMKAEAEAEAKYLHGKGIAEQRAAIVHGMQDSVQSFEDARMGVTAKDAMELILMTQYFDTLKELANNSTASCTFIPHNVGTIHDVLSTVSAQAESHGR